MDRPCFRKRYKKRPTSENLLAYNVAKNIINFWNKNAKNGLFAKSDFFLCLFSPVELMFFLRETPPFNWLVWRNDIKTTPPPIYEI